MKMLDSIPAKNQKMGALRNEIETIISKLSLSGEQFKSIGLIDWEKIEENILTKFCNITHHNLSQPGYGNIFRKTHFLLQLKTKRIAIWKSLLIIMKQYGFL